LNKVLIVAPFAGPPFIEAWRNNVRLIAKTFNCSVIVTSENNPRLLSSLPSNYFVISHHNKYIRYLLYVIYIWKNAKNYNIIFLELLPYTIYFYLLFIPLYLSGKKCIYRLNGDEVFNYSKHKILKQIFFKRISKTFWYLLVPDNNTKFQIAKKSNSIKNMKIVRPGVDLNKFIYSKPISNPLNFKFMMASAPIGEYPWKSNWKEAFRIKGIFILLDAINKFNKPQNFRFTLIWRGKFYNHLMKSIKDRRIECIDVIDETVDIYKYYKNNHVTVLPVCTTTNTPMYPNTIMESIAVGRPVIVSKSLRISDIVEKTKCGITIEPNVEELVNAFEEVIRKYDLYQAGCLFAAKKYFDYNKNISGLRKILSN